MLQLVVALCRLNPFPETPRETNVSVYDSHSQNHMGIYLLSPSSVQFSSVAKSCPTLCNPMDCSIPGLPVHHQLLELVQIHVH